MSTHEITSKVRTLKELRAEIEALESEARSIEDELKADMLTKNVDIFKIRYKTVKSSRFDSKAFKETHSKLYDQYCKPTEYKKFTVA